ncbi:hypothetical protein [Undibacterium sp. TJN19]|uniref:hypothetical protein n=1 Tax=Undibacterium sp. TJN19 TaxID=3413055 RepID=UPI003BF0BA0C
MANGALAFLAGLGSGYLNESRRQEDKERQDKFDQIRLDEAERNKSDWDFKEKPRRDIAKAAQDGGPVVDDAQVVSGLATNPSKYQDKDLAASDVRGGNRIYVKRQSQWPQRWVLPYRWEALRLNALLEFVLDGKRLGDIKLVDMSSDLIGRWQ